LSKYVDGIAGPDGKEMGKSSEQTRKQAHALVGKNLGQHMQWEDDMEHKGNKMWKAFHCFKSKVSGIGLGFQAICAAVVAVCRSVLAYGHTSRCTPEAERKWYDIIDIG
jgi:hypothetical protein